MLARLLDRPARALPAAPSYPSDLDGGTPLGRTRRALRDALVALARDAAGQGPRAASLALNEAAASGARALPGDRRWGLPPAARPTRADLERMLEDIDGAVSDLAPAPRPGPFPVAIGRPLPASALDPELARGLARANRALREADPHAYAALRAAAGRLAALAGTEIADLAARHAIDKVRAAHLSDLLAAHPRTRVPLGTVAFALATLEALTYRHARHAAH